MNRRHFLGSVAALTATLPTLAQAAPEPIIDIHQHTNYHFRPLPQLLAHQRAMGVTTTVLLPAGRMYGLEAHCGGNDSVQEVARANPDELVTFANEVADIPEAIPEIEAYLKRGAIGIGEQKFRVDCDSPHFIRIAELAQAFDVPILIHFQHEVYNTGIERFHKVLERFPRVNFIGHAQTWWGNIDKDHQQKNLYPTGKVTPGGITDRLLSDYPNMFGDHSAGSGLNALVRDEDHTRAFLQRHQDKLLFGSDCNDALGRGPGCTGAQILSLIRRLAPSKQVERKILHGNAAKLLKIKQRP